MDYQTPLFDDASGGMRVRLKAQRTHVHANLVPCIIFGRERPISVETPTGVVSGDALFVDANKDHVVNFHGGAADVIYLENGVSTSRGKFGAAQLSKEGLRILEDCADDWSVDVAMMLAEKLGITLPQCDEATMLLKNRIATDPMARLGEFEASRLVGLERTTMLRRFKQQTGMTFRAYKSWVALKHATRLVISGEQIGSAGLDAGFSDAAHFSRQFRATFGLTPSQARECVI